MAKKKEEKTEKKTTQKTDEKLVRDDNGNITLTLNVPAKKVEEARKKVTDHLISHVQVPGFRKGKAPRAKAEAQLNKNTVKEETLKLLLPDAYNEAVKEAKITPIINPQIHVEVFEEGTDLKVKATTAEAPVIKLATTKKQSKT